MTMYKNILYTEDNKNNSYSHNNNDNIIYYKKNSSKDIDIKREKTQLHLLLYSDLMISFFTRP